MIALNGQIISCRISFSFLTIALPLLRDVRWASLVVQTVKNLPATQETWIQSLGWEDPLEEGMATHSNILAWRKNPHGLRNLVGYSPWGRKELDTTERLRTAQRC